jgi:hypothetical protein
MNQWSFRLAVEALDVAVLDGFPWSDEMDLHVGGIGPGVEGLARELSSVVADDGVWAAPSRK